MKRVLNGSTYHVISLFFGYFAGLHSGTGTGMMRPCGDFRLNHERRLSSQLELVALDIFSNFHSREA
jgi:hypothetical protein